MLIRRPLEVTDVQEGKASSYDTDRLLLEFNKTWRDKIELANAKSSELSRSAPTFSAVESPRPLQGIHLTRQRVTIGKWARSW